MLRSGSLMILAMLAAGPISAQAADLSSRTYTKAPALGASYNWGGAYVGVNAGGAWGRLSPNYASQTLITTPTGLSFIQGLVTPAMDSSGFMGGGQIGYNLQIGRFVSGVEADFDYTGLRNTRSTGTFGLPACGAPCEITQYYSTDWLATFRGRLGLTTGDWLFYGTGGLALARVRYSDTFNLPGAVSAGSYNGVRTGWVLGAGAEWALNSAWTVKAEYLRVDLGSTSYVLTNNLFPTATIWVDHHLVENIGRVGVNYRF